MTQRRFPRFLSIDSFASRIALACLIAFGLLTVTGFVFAAQNWIVGGAQGRLQWPHNIMVSMAQWWLWGLLAPPIVALTFRRPIRGERLWRTLAIYLLVCIAAVLAHEIGITALERMLRRVTPGEDFAVTLQNIMLKRTGVNLLAFWLLVLIGHATTYAADMIEQTRRIARYDALLAEGQAQGSAQVAVRSRDGAVLLSGGDIDWVEAAGNYVIIHVGANAHMMRSTLEEMTAQLGPCFARVSRSALVNRDRIESLGERSPQGDMTIRLTTGQPVRLTRTYRKDLLESLPRPR